MGPYTQNIVGQRRKKQGTSDQKKRGGHFENLLSESILTLSPGNFSRFFCSLLIFFKINFFEKLFQEYNQGVKQFGSRSGLTFCPA